MRNRDELKPGRASDTKIAIVRAEVPSPELSRFLYAAVGGQWSWYSLRSWGYAQWLAYVDRPELETWVAYASGTPAGYFELERQDGGDVEIRYFGLLPRFVGQGLGRVLLTAAVERAWEIGALRVWVHTCNLDHPAALPNYQARGFRVYRTEEAIEDLPDDPLMPW